MIFVVDFIFLSLQNKMYADSTIERVESFRTIAQDEFRAEKISFDVNQLSAGKACIDRRCRNEANVHSPVINADLRVLEELGGLPASGR